MAPREKQTLTGDRVITGRLTVYGGVNSPDVVKNITDVATTKEQVTQLETTVQEISDEPFGPAIRSSAPAIVIKADGTVSPEEITFQGVVKPLNGDPSFYLGIFKIYKDGDLYYTTPSAVTSLTWTVDIVQSLTPGPEVYPAINLYPSFSNRLITIELYDDTGTTLKDSMSISILPSWESYIQNELSGYTPKYIGKFNAAHPSSYHNGDWWLVYDTDDTPITRGVYRAINYTPTLVDGSDAANSQFMVAALPDILWASNNSYGALEDYAPITYISNLVANAAFISNLFAQYIKIQTGGSIRGGDRYDEDGAVIDGTKPGFFIGASGACKVAGIEFEGSQGGGVQWSGGFQVGSELNVGAIGDSVICNINNTDIAFYEGVSKELRLYRWNGSAWALIGTPLVITGATYGGLAAINDSDVAFVDDGNKQLRLYRWGGSSWSLIGSGLSIGSNCTRPRLCAMNNSDVAYADASNKELRLYRWSGSTWSMVGSAFSYITTTFQPYPFLTTLNSTDIAFYDATSRNLRVYRWGGSSWSQIGSSLNLSASSGVAAIAAINSRDVVFIDQTLDYLCIYRWSGLSFSIISSTGSKIPSVIAPTICAMNGTDIAFVDANIERLRLYRFGFAISTPWRYPFDS